MKPLFSHALGVGALAAWLVVPAFAAEPSEAQIDFGTFTPSSSGGEFVEVHIRSNLITMAARLVEKTEPEVAELIRGLRLIRVNVISLDDKNRGEMEQRIKTIQSQLDTKGWERVVTAQERNEDVGVYVKTRGDEAIEGVVVTVIEGTKEAVLVNIVGNLRPEKLATIGERFDIEPLKHLHPAAKASEAK
jgi:hypothetical protein